MAGHYKEYEKLDLPGIGQSILNEWRDTRAFQKSIDLREGKTPFVFYEGPPSANGLPGIHHVISHTHGLPVELGVEKELGITKEDIGKKISVEEYNQKCREAVLRYKDKWDELTERMGYWVDLEHPYITYENEYIETLWWILKELYGKDLLFESVSIQPYSPAAGTGLSSHELNQPGTYKEVRDTTCVAMFSAVNNRESDFLFGKLPESDGEIFFLAWTTTPWTLSSNLGLAVGPNIEYVLVHTFNPYTHLPIYIVLAKSLLGKYFKPEDEGVDFSVYRPSSKVLPWKIVFSFPGNRLESCRYHQLLPTEAGSLEKIRNTTPDADPFRIVTGDFVTTEDGTGIVHLAPAFGADDYKVGRKNKLGILILVDKQGKFVEGVD
jgi:isoleucyl-tRNA synthetase